MQKMRHHAWNIFRCSKIPLSISNIRNLKVRLYYFLYFPCRETWEYSLPFHGESSAQGYFLKNLCESYTVFQKGILTLTTNPVNVKKQKFTHKIPDLTSKMLHISAQNKFQSALQIFMLYIWCVLVKAKLIFSIQYMQKLSPISQMLPERK